MNYQFPYTIETPVGEKLIFQRMEGDKVIVESFVNPRSGPPMHTHFKQDEALTVLSGRIGYQVLGEEPKYAGVGESVVFKRGTPHKFWAEGDEVLHCSGYVQPVHTFIFFLSSMYAAQRKSGQARPETFDAAYLMTRYSAEYDMLEIPVFVKKVIMPATYYIGKLLGKYEHFKDAPEPLK